MNTAFLIYLVMQLDSANSVIGISIFIAFMLLAVSVIFNICCMVAEGEYKDEAKKAQEHAMSIIKKSTVAIVILTVMATLTPSTKTAIYMIGGSATVEALQSAEAKEIGGKALELLQKKLDEELGK